MLGIDVSKARLAATLLEGDSRHLQWERSVPNTLAGIRSLLEHTPADCPVVLEPTGPYSTLVAQQAQASGRPVLLARPRQAKAFLAAVSPRAKTDRLDSRGLAQYALAVALPPYPLKNEAVVQVEQLLAARQGISRSLAQFKQQRAVLPAAVVQLDAAIAALKAQQAALDQQLAQMTATAAEWSMVAELDRIPGIGPVTAIAIAACLQSHHFGHPDQFVAYLGLDVRVRESGTRHGQRALSRQGDAELRRLLYLCAQANLRATDPDNPFKQHYQRERAKGLTSTAALCVVARKLARTCWSLVAHGTTYDPARVHHQPTTRPGPKPAGTLDAQP